MILFGHNDVRYLLRSEGEAFNITLWSCFAASGARTSNKPDRIMMEEDDLQHYASGMAF